MSKRPLTAAGTLLGIGLGGFVDGIVFHQLLQLHSMLSARLPQDVLINVKISMVWDGLFHTFTWLMTALGLALLWHIGKQRNTSWNGSVLFGAMLMGWGIFNFVEGLIDHFLLEVHHVVERLGLSVYDYIYLASGVAFIVAGIFFIPTAKDDQSYTTSS